MQGPSMTNSFVSSASGRPDKGFQGSVSKLSKRQWFFHERYLLVRGGQISYFSGKPDPGREENPKAKVTAADCQITIANAELSRKKKRPYMFQITFFVQAAAKRTPVTWIFAVETQEVLHEWLAALHRAQHPEPDMDDAENEERRQAEVKNQDEETKVRVMRGELLEKERKEREEQRRLQELEKRKARQREKEQEEARRKQQIDQELKRLQEEAEKRRKEQYESARRAKFQKLLEHSWDYKFQKLWSRSIVTMEFEESLKIGVRLYQHLGSFRVKTQSTARLIIDELHLPSDQRQIQPIAIDPQPVYIYQNIVFRLAWPHSQFDSVKLLGHEFRAADMVADALFLLARKDQTMSFRVPLMCVVDYKGFRVLAVALAPLDGDHTLLHGPSQEGIYEACVPLYKHLSFLAQVLNLKEHKFEWNERMEPAYVHLSAFVQVHRSKGYTDLENYVRETSGEEVLEDPTEHHYLLKVSDLLPVDAEGDSDSMDFSKRLRPEFLCEYSVPLSADGFINQSSESSPSDDLDLLQASKLLRAGHISKFVGLLDSMQLLPIDSKSMTEAMHANGVNARCLGRIADITTMPHVREMAVVEAVGRTVKRLMFEELTNLILNYTDEGAVSDERGIIEDPKVFLRNESVRPKQFEGNYYDPTPAAPQAAPTGRKRAFSKKTTISLQMPGFEEADKWSNAEIVSKGAHIQMENDLQTCIIDFLNLVFGAGDESETFWSRILLPQAYARFSLPIELGMRSVVNLRALLHSVCYHCGLRLVFFKDVQLGTASEPFAQQSLERVVEKWKVFNLRNSEYRLLADKYAEYREERSYQLALQACNLHFRISKALAPEEEFYGDPALLADIGEIMLDSGDLEGAIKKAKESLVQVHPLHIESVKPWCVLMRALMKKNLLHEALQCFDSALSALEFHWGAYHPLYATVCSILAYLYLERKEYEDALVLYKSGLMCSLKVLGPNHTQTAEIYSELSTLYSHMSLWSEALVACEKSFRIYEARLGATAPSTLNLAVQLAKLFGSQGRSQEAVQLITQLVETRERLISESESKELAANHRTRVFEALTVGLDLAERLQDPGLVSLYGGKMWNYMECGFVLFDTGISSMLLRKMVKAGLELLPAEQRSLFMSALINSDAYEVDVDPEHLQSSISLLQSPSILPKTKEKGGIKTYLSQLFEAVCKSYRLVKTAGRPEDVRTLQRGLTEAAALLEAVGPDVIEM